MNEKPDAVKLVHITINYTDLRFNDDVLPDLFAVLFFITQCIKFSLVFVVQMETPVYVNGTYSVSGKSISLKRVINHKQELQKEIADLEKLQKTLQQQRQDLEFLNESIKRWAQIFDKIERNSQGVPFVRNVKETCAQIENHLNDIHGDFYFRMQNLVTADVPCFQQVYEALELLKKQVSKILNDDAAYKASFIEEIRQLLGRLSGITDTMLEIYFEE